MTIMTSSGARVFASAALPLTYDAAGYAALTWTEVKEITSLSPFGPSRAEVTLDTLGDGYTKTYKGQTNYGRLEGEMAYVSDDAGQMLLRANIGLNTDIGFKVLFPDGSVTYSAGQSFDGQRNIGATNSIIMSTFKCIFNKPPVDVAA